MARRGVAWRGVAPDRIVGRTLHLLHPVALHMMHGSDTRDVRSPRAATPRPPLPHFRSHYPHPRRLQRGAAFVSCVVHCSKIVVVRFTNSAKVYNPMGLSNKGRCLKNVTPYLRHRPLLLGPIESSVVTFRWSSKNTKDPTLHKTTSTDQK